ncbi:MAG: DctP family TRAP transporter solute-binding subunit [Brachybacterium sp.]|nr:DctP family TRAP transporter solute-binding subunit [Brachybacterium sp.]
MTSTPSRHENVRAPRPPLLARAGRMIPRRGALAAGALAALALPGCGLTEPVDTSAVQTPDDDPDARVVRFGHPYDPSHVVETTGVQILREELAPHGIVLRSYPSAQLGGEAETAEQVATGGLEFAVVGPSFLGVWNSPAAVLDAAYLFTSVEQFDQATTGEVMGRINDETAEKTGLRALATWFYGNRHITSNRPIIQPSDLDGLRIRTPDAPMYLTNFGIMGGSPTPMALSEAYLGLQQGTIDAQENPIPTIEVQRFYEVQDYLNLSAHCVQGINIVTSEHFLDTLEPEQRDAVHDAVETARVAIRDAVVAEEEDILATWREEDAITINDEVDIDAFQALVAEEMPDRVAWGDLYLEIQESVQ